MGWRRALFMWHLIDSSYFLFNAQGSGLTPAASHSMENLVTSLSAYRLLAALDPALELGDACIFDRFSNQKKLCPIDFFAWGFRKI